MKRLFCIFWGSLLFLCMTSCSGLMPAGTVDWGSYEVSLIPGECLMNNDLSCIYSNGAEHHTKYRFVFAMNVDVDYDVVEYRDFLQQHPKVHRHIPSESVFNTFGGNSKQVKKEYESVWNQLDVTQCTFFYKEGISLIADKEFAGIPAGENLAGLITINESSHTSEKPITSYIAPFDSEQDKMVRMGTTSFYVIYGRSNNMDSYNAAEQEHVDVENQAFFAFSIPSEGCTYVDESINFRLEIPIKSAQYLTWLNAKLSDENAQMTWKDEVLTCNFRAIVRLHKETE